MIIENKTSSFSNEIDIEDNDSKNSNNIQNSNYQQKPVIDKRFILLNIIGTGAFSKVWKSLDMETTKIVALKNFLKNKDLQSLANTAIEEVKAM